MRKSNLKLSILNPATRRIFTVIAALTDASAFTLIGGTALSLQIGHRVSNDLDFAVFLERLPTQKVDKLIATLKEQGHSVSLITDPSKISIFKINTGESLLNFARDYTVDDVKITFFAHGRNEQQRSFYRKTPTVVSNEVSFPILGIEGLNTAKTLVLADRVRSRDLFDLMILIRDHGFSIATALAIAEKLGTNNDPEYYKAVMTGKIPLDEEDEGLATVSVTTPIDDIYDFFKKAVEQYEISLAAEFWRKAKHGK